MRKSKQAEPNGVVAILQALMPPGPQRGNPFWIGFAVGSITTAAVMFGVTLWVVV